MEAAQLSLSTKAEQVRIVQEARELLRTIEERFDEGTLDESLVNLGPLGLARENGEPIPTETIREIDYNTVLLSAYNALVSGINAGFGKKMLEYFGALQASEALELSELVQVTSLQRLLDQLRAVAKTFRYPESGKTEELLDADLLESTCNKVLEAKNFFDSMLPHIAQQLVHEMNIEFSAASDCILKEATSIQQSLLAPYDELYGSLTDVKLAFLEIAWRERKRRHDEAVASIYVIAGNFVLNALNEAQQALERGEDPDEYFAYKARQVLNNDTVIYRDQIDVKESTEISGAAPIVIMRDFLEKLGVKATKVRDSFEAYRREKFIDALYALKQDALNDTQRTRLETVTVFDFIKHVASHAPSPQAQSTNLRHYGLSPDHYSAVSEDEWSTRADKALKEVLLSKKESLSAKEQAAFDFYFCGDKSYEFVPEEGFGPNIDGFIEFAERSQELRLKAFHRYSLCSIDEKKRMALELYQLERARINKVFDQRLGIN